VPWTVAGEAAFCDATDVTSLGVLGVGLSIIKS